MGVLILDRESGGQEAPQVWSRTEFLSGAVSATRFSLSDVLRFGLLVSAQFIVPVTNPNCRFFSFSLSTAAFGLLVLAGCASRPAGVDSVIAEVVEPPSEWQSRAPNLAGAATPSTGEGLASWWNRFDDPILISLIDQALDTSPDLLTAGSRIAVAQAERLVSRADLFPTIGASVGGAANQTRNHETNTTTRLRYRAGSRARGMDRTRGLLSQCDGGPDHACHCARRYQVFGKRIRTEGRVAGHL